MTNYEVSSSAIVICNNDVLCITEQILGSEKTSFPKGHIKVNEDSIDAAIRECFEETGVMLTRKDFRFQMEPTIVSFLDETGMVHNKKIVHSVFKITKKRNIEIREKQVVDACFLNIGEFIMKASYKSDRELITDVISRLRLEEENYK